MSPFCRDKPAMLVQKWPVAPERRSQVTRHVLIALLRKAHWEDRALEWSEFRQTAIAQFTACISELREHGCRIKNVIRWSANGRLLSVNRRDGGCE